MIFVVAMVEVSESVADKAKRQDGIDWFVETAGFRLIEDVQFAAEYLSIHWSKSQMRCKHPRGRVGKRFVGYTP